MSHAPGEMQSYVLADTGRTLTSKGVSTKRIMHSGKIPTTGFVSLKEGNQMQNSTAMTLSSALLVCVLFAVVGGGCIIAPPQTNTADMNNDSVVSDQEYEQYIRSTTVRGIDKIMHRTDDAYYERRHQQRLRQLRERTYPKDELENLKGRGQQKHGELQNDPRRRGPF